DDEAGKLRPPFALAAGDGLHGDARVQFIRCIGDKNFRAVDLPAAIHFFRDGFAAARVRTCAGFGETEGPELVLTKLRDVFFLLASITKKKRRPDAKRVLGSDGRRMRPPPPSDLSAGTGVGEKTDPMPAIFRRYDNTEQAKLAHLARDILGEFAFFIEL